MTDRKSVQKTGDKGLARQSNKSALPAVNEANPWQTLDSEVRYENPWLQVIHHNVLNPSGNPGIYGKVHFKNRAIAILPFDSDYNTWLVGQYRFTLSAYSWEIPEGGGPEESDPLQAAQRELLEETGIVAKQWTQLLELHLSNSVSDELAIGYIAQDLQFEDAQPEDSEDLTVAKLPFDEVLQMSMDGRITDALAVACILKAARLIDAGDI